MDNQFSVTLPIADSRLISNEMGRTSNKLGKFYAPLLREMYSSWPGSKKKFAALVEVSPLTIRRHLKGKSTPQNMEVMRGYARNLKFDPQAIEDLLQHLIVEQRVPLPGELSVVSAKVSASGKNELHFNPLDANTRTDS